MEDFYSEYDLSPLDSHSKAFILFHQRMKDLEEKVYRKNKRKNTDRAQQMILIKYSGIYEAIEKLSIQQIKQKAKFLSILLNADETNIEDDLRNIQNRDIKRHNKKDVEFLISTLKECGLKEQAEKIEKEYFSK